MSLLFQEYAFDPRLNRGKATVYTGSTRNLTYYAKLMPALLPLRDLLVQAEPCGAGPRVTPLEWYQDVFTGREHA